ncbi:MAG: hypothetical protein O3A15_06695, partial [Proteobacteria bacterium]|nr:hypothetical protein [Pseudomonadota bacterium]
MKNLLFVAFLFVQFFSFAQVTYNISGHAYLEGETDHSPVVFSMINPQNLDTIASSSPYADGFYTMEVPPGFYLLNWSHYGHISQELGDFTFTADTVLTDVTLMSGFVQEVCGEVSGVWPSGFVYHVMCDITIPEGESLSIEEGVTVRFAEGTGM